MLFQLIFELIILYVLADIQTFFYRWDVFKTRPKSDAGGSKAPNPIQCLSFREASLLRQWQRK
jgi:hypothetical protein